MFVTQTCFRDEIDLRGLITITHLILYTAILFRCKNENFKLKNLDMFLIFAQNIDCGYTNEAVLTSTHNL